MTPVGCAAEHDGGLSKHDDGCFSTPSPPLRVTLGLDPRVQAALSAQPQERSPQANSSTSTPQTTSPQPSNSTRVIFSLKNSTEVAMVNSIST